MNKAETLEAIKQAHREWKEAFYRMAEESRKNALIYAKPAEIPLYTAEGYIYGEAYKELFAQESARLKALALDHLEAYRKAIGAEKSEAPSEEAVRALTVLQMLDPGTMDKPRYRDEMQGVADRYGKNYMVGRVLYEMAYKNGVELTLPEAFNSHIALDKVKEVIESGFDSAGANTQGKGSVERENLFDFAIDLNAQ